jgi:hypothetical protein
MSQFPPTLQFSGSITSAVTSPSIDCQGYSSIYVMVFSNANCTADINWSILNGPGTPVFDYSDSNTNVGTFIMSHPIRSRFFKFTVTPSVNPQTLRYSIYLCP